MLDEQEESKVKPIGFPSSNCSTDPSYESKEDGTVGFCVAGDSSNKVI